MDFFAQFEKDVYAKRMGIELVEIGEGRAVARMKLRPHHLNSVGVAHGGAIFTLADFVFAAVADSHATVTLGVESSISFLRAISNPGETLTATGEEVSLKDRFSCCRVQVTDSQGEVIAIFQGLAYRKKDKLEGFVFPGK